MNGLLRLGELADELVESFSSEYTLLFTVLILAKGAECGYSSGTGASFALFDVLLKLVPGLEERIVKGFDDETTRIGELVTFVYIYLGHAGQLNIS